MQLLIPLITLMRARQLAQQYRAIERQIHALPDRNRERLAMQTLREIGQASRSDFPHLYGTPPEARYLPWGMGTGAGFERACSANAEVAVRGIALWLAVAYHETKHSPHARMQSMHRMLLRLLREMKDARNEGPADTAERWMQTGQAA